jgi:threonine/homoserine/homoserine lactone efflux protein
VLALFLQGLGYGFSAATQPGPFQTFVISHTLQRGWRRALPVSLAPLISDGPIIALMLLVLSQVPPWLIRGLHIVGGLFVLYLAWGAYRSWRQDEAAPVETAPSQQGLLKAAATNALSPGPYIFWGTVTGPILVAGWREMPANGIGFLLGFYVAMVGTLTGLIVVFGTARQIGPKVTRALLGISAIALAAFGLYQLWLGVSGLL